MTEIIESAILGGTSAVGFSMGLTYQFNEDLLNDIYQWYHNHYIISRFHQLENEHVFPQDMKIRINGILDIDDTESDDIKALARLVIDYRLMFGFVPLLIYKNESNEIKIKVPDFGTVNIFLTLSKIDRQCKVICKPKTLLMENDKYSSSLDDDIFPKYIVYNWSDLVPNFMNKMIKSPLYPCFKQWLIVKEFERNSLEGDFLNTHPPIVYKNVMKTSPSMTISSEATKTMYNNFGNSLQTDPISLRDETSKSMYYNQIASYDRLTSSMKESSNYLIPGFGSSKTSKVLDQNIYNTIRSSINNEIIIAPEGYEVESRFAATITKNIMEMYQNVDNIIIASIGIPASLVIDRESSRKYLISQTREVIQGDQRKFKQTIDLLRSQFEIFLQHIYIHLSRPKLRDKAKKGLDDLDDIYTNQKNYVMTKLKDEDESRQYNELLDHKEQRIRSEIGSLVSKPKIKIEYPPEVILVDYNIIPEIIEAYTRGVLTEPEYVTLFRSKLGMQTHQDYNPDIYKQNYPSELIKKVKEKAKLLEQQMLPKNNTNIPTKKPDDKDKLKSKSEKDESQKKKSKDKEKKKTDNKNEETEPSKKRKTETKSKERTKKSKTE